MRRLISTIVVILFILLVVYDVFFINKGVQSNSMGIWNPYTLALIIGIMVFGTTWILSSTFSSFVKYLPVIVAGIGIIGFAVWSILVVRGWEGLGILMVCVYVIPFAFLSFFKALIPNKTPSSKG